MSKSTEMNGRFLIDTNILIDFFKGNQVIKTKLAQEEVLVPSIVIGELFYGAYSSGVLANKKKRLAEVTTFIDSYPVLELGKTTAQYYGNLKSQLKSSGTPIPENDLWIAALALEHGIVLVTSDQHFDYIKDLKTVKW